MRIKDVSRWIGTMVCHVRIEDGPRVPVAYSQAGGQYRVDLIVIAWEVHDETESWKASSVTLTGPRIKKDGTEGKSEYTATLYWYNIDALLEGKPEAVKTYGWLLPVLEALRPRGLPPAPPTRESMDAASTDREGTV